MDGTAPITIDELAQLQMLLDACRESDFTSDEQDAALAHAIKILRLSLSKNDKT